MKTFYTITPHQLMILRGCSYNTARKELRSIRDSLGLVESQPLMLRHVAGFWSVPVEELAEALYKKYKKVA